MKGGGAWRTFRGAFLEIMLEVIAKEELGIEQIKFRGKKWF